MHATPATSRRIAAALAVTVLLAGAGCSDADDDAGGAGAATTTAASGTDTTVGGDHASSDGDAPGTTIDGATPDDDGDTDGTDGDHDAVTGTTVASIGELPPISGGAPVRVLSCEPDDSGHLVATIELDNITDLPLDATVEVLFEDEAAVELERAVGKIPIIQPGESATGTVTTEGAVAIDGANCLLIGMERHEYLPDEVPADS